MHFKLARPSFLKIPKLLLYMLLVFFLHACVQQSETPDARVKKQLDISDSLYYDGHGDKSDVLLAKLRPQINTTDPLISTYYCMRAQHYFNNAEGMNRYADSALAYFKNESRKADHPNEYLQALLTKGDACLKAKKYTLALRYYYQGKEVLPDSECDNGTLASKIGGIYYDQKKFVLAARYWADSYTRLQNCDQKINAQKLFFLKQGTLNNAGFSYERAGIADSAMYYYLKDLALIKATDSLKLLRPVDINGALGIVYDNLGGLSLKQNNLAAAEDYLQKSMAIPLHITDGVRIPPLLKLTDLYLRKKEYAKAALTLKQSGDYLNLYYRDNAVSQLNWFKLNAEYLSLTGKPAEAYRYQAGYMHMKDSADNSSTELYRLDVEREMNTLQQERSLILLKQNNNVKQLYLEGSVVIAVLFVAIILLVNRNLNRTKELNKSTVLQNHQLQSALSELETLNKNYIRVMRVMAHDLRNPLSGIMGISSMVLAEEDNLSDENQYLLKLIESTSKSSLEMINELLHSGLTDESAVMIKSPTDLRALLNDSVELLQFRARDKRQQIVFESSQPSIIALVNHEKIWRLFNNLIVNAIKFSHDGGIINVAIRQEKNTILISVADNGVGIPDKDKDSIFEMFTPAKKAGTQGEQPFGLGLSIAKRIIEAHGGRIWFESVPDEGTVFYVELPV
jgi:signal transduction histidine kinase